MAELGTINWVGESGKSYTYRIYPMNTVLNKAPGNYVFAMMKSESKLRAVFIGQAEDLSDIGVSTHEMSCIMRNGGTHICVHESPYEKERIAEATDLIVNYKPNCNKLI